MSLCYVTLLANENNSLAVCQFVVEDLSFKWVTFIIYSIAAFVHAQNMNWTAERGRENLKPSSAAWNLSNVPCALSSGCFIGSDSCGLSVLNRMRSILLDYFILNKSASSLIVCVNAFKHDGRLSPCYLLTASAPSVWMGIRWLWGKLVYIRYNLPKIIVCIVPFDQCVDRKPWVWSWR